MTLTGHHFYLITKVCWNLGTSQSNRFHGISNIFPHVAGEVIYHLQVKTCCSDCGASQTHLQTDTLSLSQAVSSRNPAHQLWMSSTVLALISASAWLSHPVGSVSAMIKGNAQCRCHFHKSGHAGAAVVGISCEAPASLGAGTVVLSWGWARISHSHTAHWGWKHLGPLMLLGVSQDLGMTTGQQFLDIFTQNSYLKSSYLVSCHGMHDSEGSEGHFPRSGESNTLWFLRWWFISIHRQKLLP